MITSNDLRNGMTIIYNGVIHEVVDAQHIKPGKGHAFVRTRLKNLVNGSQFEYSFRAKEPLEQAIVDKRELKYSYRDKDVIYFMDGSTFEQVPVHVEKVQTLLEYLKEEEIVYFTFYEGQVIEASLPEFMTFRVKEALPGIKGDTVQGGSKPVTLETGKVVLVPLFIVEGDVLKIDTRTGRYVERVKCASGGN